MKVIDTKPPTYVDSLIAEGIKSTTWKAENTLEERKTEVSR